MAKDKRRKVGELAPEFHLRDQNDKTVSLSDLLGEDKYVLLYFVSSAEKKRCDRSGCPLKENLDKVKELGVIPVVIDEDPVFEHEKFSRDHGIDFPILSDPDMTTIKGYGVYEKVNVNGIEKEKVVSTVYLINPKGYIIGVWEPKVIEESIDDIINAIKSVKK
jgi:peroxiredoxin Q/BCP